MAGRSLIPAQRRRAQNRASQRAFRERKERHVKNLEQQLDDLHQQYEELLLAYDQQKEDISSLRVELLEAHRENRPTEVPQNSPLEFASTLQAQNFQSDSDSLQFQQNDHLLPQSQSLTPASSFENQFPSRTSTSEELTAFGSLLPLTPAGNFEHPVIFRASDLFFAAGEDTRCYTGSSSDCQETRKPVQRDEFSSPGIREEFAVNPSRDLFEGWR